MDFTLNWNSAPEDLLITTRGPASVDDLAAMCEAAFTDPRFQPGVRVLIDHRLAEYGSLSHDQARQRADWVAARAGEIAGSRTAVVVARRVDFGVWRVFEAYAPDDATFAMKVFLTLDEARSWLVEPGA